MATPEPNILITGATGFIGRRVCQSLRSRGLRFSAPSRNSEIGGLDVLNPESVNAYFSRNHPTHLLHLAWMVEHGKFWHSSDNWTWLLASQNLLRRFAEAGGHRVVFSGTCAEYQWSGLISPCREEITPLMPETLYGATKLALYEASRVIAQFKDISFGWSRLFFPYGTGEPPQKLVSSIVLALLANKESHTGSGRVIRDLIHVDDAAEALISLLLTELTGAVNIGSGHGVALKDVMAEIGKQLNKSHLLHVGARPDPTHEPAFLVSDMDRLIKGSSWRPKLSLSEGISQTIEGIKRIPTS